MAFVALEQLERSADYRVGVEQAKASRMRELIDGAADAGTPVTILQDTDGPSGAVVFGDIDLPKPTLMERVKRLFR